MSPGPIQGHNDFWWAYYTQGRGLYIGGPIDEDKKVVSFGNAYVNSMGNLYSKSLILAVFFFIFA